MEESEKAFLLALTQITGLGPATINNLFNRYSSFSTIWSLGPSFWEIKNRKHLDQALLEHHDVNPQALLDDIYRRNIKLISFYDEEYPNLLKEIYDPPVLLYYRGNLKLLSHICVGVVGTRNATQYGQQAIEKLLPELTRAGVVIVSGFQRGIDTYAHKCTISAGGSTIAVLGTGLDVLYPWQNRLLHKTISDEHLMITEYSPQTEPFAHNFPRRNRIITGLSKATLVVEASLKSGSLVSAQYALDQNRELLAVPGSIFMPLSIGTNYLIKQGATPVTEPEDILNILGIESIRKEQSHHVGTFSVVQQKILNALDNEAKSVDQLIQLTNLSPAQVLPEITLLELSHSIIEVESGRYAKI